MTKSKEEKTWTCGDCGAIHHRKVKLSNAPNHDLHVDLLKAKWKIRELEYELSLSKTSWYMPRARFIKEYTDALEEYVAQSFPNEQNYHPYDLACSVASFNDAFFALMSNMDFRPTDK